MKLLRVAAAALNQTPLDWDRNAGNIRAALDEARRQGAALLCLPELCITGYGCEDAFLSPDVQQTALETLGELLVETRGLVVSVGLPLLVNGAVYDVCALLDDGRILGFVAKQMLAGDGIHYEPRWFKAWPRGERGTVRVLGTELPVGDLYFECGTVRVGFEICEDFWVGDRPGIELCRHGVDIVLNPSASHFSFHKREMRRRMVIEGSRAFGASYVFSNLVGNEAGRAIYDGELVIASDGRVLEQGRPVYEGGRLGYRDIRVISATVDVDATRTQRSWRHHYHPHSSVAPGQRIVSERPLPDAAPEPRRGDVAENAIPKEEEFARAIALALFDYLRKSRSHGFVVSLSGGADSSAVLTLAALGLRFAERELGLEGLQAKLSYIPEVRQAKSLDQILRHLLVACYQATRNSSDVTREAARAVAEANGAEFLELDVDPMVEGYRGLVARAVGRQLSWERDDITLQNIQARVRSPSIWMIANLRGALLLATSNRSEAAVGYATMDGDTSGGLSPIAGIDKAFLRQWLCWMEQTGPRVGEAERWPMPALAHVNAQQPTAELRPQDQKQTDEADLMPYELLDAIERVAIHLKVGPLGVYRQMRVDFPQYEPERLLVWVERFFTLWSRNQWKRERYAPSFHVDDANLDPKTWCRWPILSGGFRRELAALRQQVEGRS